MNAAYLDIHARVALAGAAAGHAVSMVAVSKTKPATAIRALAALGQQAFGENHVAEAQDKQRELLDLNLEWHLIGPLQSNKSRAAAQHFAWVQSLDRDKLVAALSRHRPADRPPLNVLIQVNIDAETTKSGCAPEEITHLASQISATSNLRLRGLMAIPEPHREIKRRRHAFQRMHALFIGLQRSHPLVDTLSMGMSDDFELAIAHGATMVRIGTALFGPR